MNFGMTQGMLTAAVAVSVVGMSALTQAAVITQWTFEGDVGDVLTPSTGTGTTAYVGNTLAASSGEFALGNGGGRGWNTSNYPTQSTNSGTAGVQFSVSTAGYQDIAISFDHRASGAASRWAQVLYTTDGLTWNILGNNGGGLSPHDTFYGPFVFNLPSDANNQVNFAFRVVSIFSPADFNENSSVSFSANTAYMRANAQATYPPAGGSGSGVYSISGTWRFDNVTISGTVIPEPASMALLAMASGVMLLRRRQA